MYVGRFNVVDAYRGWWVAYPNATHLSLPWLVVREQ